MSEFLVIHYKPGLHDSDGNPALQYWALGGDQHPSITLGHSNLEELQTVARGKKISILIDAHFITLESVNVPSKNRSKQLLAVPFAMEDFLAEDIEGIHFALGKSESARVEHAKLESMKSEHGDTESNSPEIETSEGNKVPVIAIKLSLLQEILSLFKQYQIYPEIVTADSIALPGSRSKWSIILDEDGALIKTGHTQAHSCDRENLPFILQALLDQNEYKPDSITYYYKADDTEAESMLNDIEIQLEPQPYQTHSLEIFVQHLNETSSLNLLQGEFTPKRESNIWLQPWKTAATLAGVWIVLHLAYASITTTQLEDKNIVLTSQIEREFKRAIPDARKMINMKKRVDRRLKELQSTGNGSSASGFLDILSKATPMLANNEKLNIKAAIYRNNYIDVDLTAKTLQDIEQVKDKLTKVSGIKTILSTSVEKGKVKGRLRLEAKG